MRATRLTFFRVARGAVPAIPWIRPGVVEVSAFLAAHVAGLRDRATEGSAAHALFANPADLQLMQDIRSGDESAFLAAAGILGTRLVAEMHHVGGALPGLLVCSTLVSDTDPTIAYAVVLKLQVVSEQGAVLQRLDTGEETLAPVTDVLDRPGELQKGLVFPDERPDSQAVVGDKAAQQEARYFLRAMGVTLEARDSASAGALVAAVAHRAGRVIAEQVVQALPSVQPAAPREVLATLGQTIPDLTEAAVADIAEALVTAERPVVRIDTSAHVTARLRAGALTLTGPADEVRRVTWESDPEGGWRIAFRSDQEPKVTWR